MIPLLFLTNAYTYHWVVCTTAAMMRVIRRKKPHWAVTQKQVISESSETEVAEPIQIEINKPAHVSRSKGEAK